MKNTYMEPCIKVIDLDFEDAVMLTASGVMKMDENISTNQQLSNEKDLWGNEDIWK